MVNEIINKTMLLINIYIIFLSVYIYYKFVRGIELISQLILDVFMSNITNHKRHVPRSDNLDDNSCDFTSIFDEIECLREFKDVYYLNG